MSATPRMYQRSHQATDMRTAMVCGCAISARPGRSGLCHQ
jgi:hypothetical protein